MEKCLKTIFHSSLQTSKLLLQGGSAEVELKKGDKIKLTTDKAYESKGTKDMVYVDYENIQKVVAPGNRIYLDDGLMSLVVDDISGSVLTCTIENGGMLGSRKGTNYLIITANVL